VGEFVPVAETELGPGAEFELALGDAFEAECVAFAGLDQTAEPEPVHKFGLVSGDEADYGFEAGSEAVWVSQWIQQRKLVIPSYEPAQLKWAYEAPAAWTQ